MRTTLGEESNMRLPALRLGGSLSKAEIWVWTIVCRGTLKAKPKQLHFPCLGADVSFLLSFLPASLHDDVQRILQVMSCSVPMGGGFAPESPERRPTKP